MKPLYNNYVRQPLGIFLISAVVILASTIIVVDLIVSMAKECSVPAAFHEVEIIPTGYSYVNKSMLITTENGDFVVYQEAIASSSLCNEIEQGRMLIGKHSAEETFPYLTLWELRSKDGTVFVSINGSQAAAQNYTTPICVGFSIALILIWSIYLGSTYVLYHAPRYPRLAKLLIRKEFRNF